MVLPVTDVLTCDLAVFALSGAQRPAGCPAAQCYSEVRPSLRQWQSVHCEGLAALLAPIYKLRALYNVIKWLVLAPKPLVDVTFGSACAALPLSLADCCRATPTCTYH